MTFQDSKAWVPQRKLGLRFMALTKVVRRLRLQSFLSVDSFLSFLMSYSVSFYTEFYTV